MDTYGHPFESSARESAERMGRLFGAKKPDAPDTTRPTAGKRRS